MINHLRQEAYEIVEDWKRRLRDRLPPQTLHDAAYRGDIGRVQLFLARGVDANKPDEHGICAIGYASAQGHFEIVQLLLTAGAWVDSIGETDKRLEIFTPLMGAVTGSKLDIAHLLIERRANLNLSDRFGDTALMLASRWADADAVRLLLGAGANVNAANKDGNTPLMSAVSFHKREAVRVLLEHGARVDAHDAKGRTALMMAAEDADVTVAKLLLEQGADVSLRDADGRISLEYAKPKSPYGFSAELFAPVIALLEQAGGIESKTDEEASE